MNDNEKKLLDYLHNLECCPICNGNQKTNHENGCPLEPYMKFVPKDLNIGDIIAYKHNAMRKCIVKNIIDDYTITAYEVLTDITLKINANDFTVMKYKKQI